MYNKQQIYNSLPGSHSPLLAQGAPVLSQNKYCERQIQLFKERAEEYLQQGIPPLLYSDFCKYFETGDRLAFQAPYYKRRGHLLVFSVLAKETGEEKYINALNEIIFALCSELTWCLPAHLLDQNDEEIEPENYAVHLDLFSAETAFALAEAMALCEKYIPARLKHIAKQNIENRIFKPFEREDILYRFERMTNNWSAVCAGAIGGAAMYLIDDNARLCSLLHRCLSCMSVYLSSFGSDGVCAEGVDYWNYGFGFFVAFAQLLQVRTNNKLNLFENKKVEAIAKAGTEFYLGETATISFSDGSENGAYRMGLMCFLSREYNFSIPAPVAAADTLLDSCYRYCTAIRDLYQTSENPSYLIGSAGTTWLADAQWLIVRDSECGMAAKAGHNNESHNHNDCGSFIFVKSGQQIICDLGAGLYDKAYFSDTRYNILVNRSASHNIALINGTEQLAGEKFASKVVQITENGLVCELSACYNDSALKKYRRSISMSGKQIKLEDNFEFSQSSSVSIVFCAKEPILVNNNTAVFTRGGQSAQLVFDSEKFSPKVINEEYATNRQSCCSAYFLHLTNKENAKAITFKATIK